MIKGPSNTGNLSSVWLPPTIASSVCMGKLDTWVYNSDLVRILLLISHVSMRKVFSSLLISVLLHGVIWPAPTRPHPETVQLCPWLTWFSYLTPLDSLVRGLALSGSFLQANFMLNTSTLKDWALSECPSKKKLECGQIHCPRLANSPIKENKIFFSSSLKSNQMTPFIQNLKLETKTTFSSLIQYYVLKYFIS